MKVFLKTIMKLLLSLLPFGYIAESAAQQIPIIEQAEVIKEGVQLIQVYPDTIIIDTIEIEEWIEMNTPKNKSTKEYEESNERLRYWNEQLKKEPE